MSLSLIMATLIASVSPADAANEITQSKNGEFILSKYPPRALAAGEEGEVHYRADVNENGLVFSCQVTQSSGFRRLDEETCELIVRYGTFKPTLDGEGKARRATHDGIVNWRIPDRAAGAAPVKLVDAKETEKLICKRSRKTGSLVVHSRLCLSARDWDRYADENQEIWGDLQGRRGHTNGKMPTWSFGQ